MSPHPRSRRLSLRRLVDEVLEAADLQTLSQRLTRDLPEALGVASVTLLLWDRKLDSFESFPPGEARRKPADPSEPAPSPEAHWLLSEAQLLETGGRGDGTLVPLMARSGLVGMLVLGSRGRRRHPPYGPAEVRLLSTLAGRCALAIENHLYQHELISSERLAALGTMAGMLAHDFRGPMTVIRGYAETLLDRSLPRDEIVSRAHLITEMIDRLQRMTNETLDFARGGGRLACRPMRLAKFLTMLAGDLAEELPGLEITTDFQVSPESEGSLDADKVSRAVGNIAANARDAAGGRGRLLIEARVEDEALVLLLADDGPGVSAQVRDRIFEPFVTHGKKGGTGLGLAVARRFVEDHGGTVELLPEGPGARFRLRLPLLPPGAAPPG